MFLNVLEDEINTVCIICNMLDNGDQKIISSLHYLQYIRGWDHTITT